MDLMNIVYEYGFLKSAAKYHEKLTQLSDNNIQRLNDASLLKSPNQLAAGINKGTVNILKDTGFNVREHGGYRNIIPLSHVTHPSFFGSGGIISIPNPKSIGDYVPHKMALGVLSKTNPVDVTRGDVNLTNALLTRHEAYEAQAIKKNPNVATGFSSSGNRHMNLNVLGKENKDVIRTGHTLGSKALRNFRASSGERDILGEITGKPYGSQIYNSGEISALTKANPATYKGGEWLSTSSKMIDSVAPHLAPLKNNQNVLLKALGHLDAAPKMWSSYRAPLLSKVQSFFK